MLSSSSPEVLACAIWELSVNQSIKARHIEPQQADIGPVWWAGSVLHDRDLEHSRLKRKLAQMSARPVAAPGCCCSSLPTALL